MSALARLAALGLSLPPAPAPAAAYRPYSRLGELILVAGQLPLVDGALPRTGRLGEELDTEDGRELARLAALNVLAVVAAATGDLERARIARLTVYVASTPDYAEHHLVANGASELVAGVLGDHGAHARSAVGVAALPLRSPVEVEAIATDLPR